MARKPQRRSISQKTARSAKGRAPKGRPGKGRGPGRPFKKGQSGNLLGRPPLPADWKVFVENKWGPKALRALDYILEHPEHPRFGQAAEYAFSQWKGAPKQRTELSGPGGGAIPVKAVMTSDEKRARQRHLAETATARIASGTPPPADGGDAGGSPPGDSD